MENEWEGREHGRHTHDGINVHARCLHFRQHDNAVMFIFFSKLRSHYNHKAVEGMLCVMRSLNLMPVIRIYAGSKSFEGNDYDTMCVSCNAATNFNSLIKCDAIISQCREG